MTNSDTAKKGFKTFVLTLSVSLIVFSVIYYLLTNSTQDTKRSSEVSMEVTTEQVQGAQTQNVSEEKTPVDTVQTQVAADTKTVFGSIAEKKPTAQAKQVLSGSTQTTQSTSTVPNTGYVEITVGLLVSLVLFIGGMFVVSSNPRKVALNDFEKKFLRK